MATILADDLVFGLDDDVEERAFALRKAQAHCVGAGGKAWFRESVASSTAYVLTRSGARVTAIRNPASQLGITEQTRGGSHSPDDSHSPQATSSSGASQSRTAIIP